MAEKSKNLVEGLLEEIARNKELLAVYAQYRNMEGVITVFAEAGISYDLAVAERALADGDVVAMVEAYSALKGNE